MGYTYTKMLFNLIDFLILPGNAISSISVLNKITNSLLFLLTLMGFTNMPFGGSGREVLPFQKHWEDFEPKVKSEEMVLVVWEG